MSIINACVDDGYESSSSDEEENLLEQQRRQTTERRHASIERGRHPRSFQRQHNDLWKHVDNSEVRRKSVFRGQGLRRVSSTMGQVEHYHPRVATNELKASHASSLNTQQTETSKQEGGGPNNKKLERKNTILNFALLSAEDQRNKLQDLSRPSTEGEEIANHLAENNDEEKEFTTQRKIAGLSRRMSQFRIENASKRKLQPMLGRRELANKIENKGLRKLRQKRFTQRLVGLDGFGEKEYEPMSDKAFTKRRRKRKSSFFGAKHFVLKKRTESQLMRSPESPIKVKDKRKPVNVATASFLSPNTAVSVVSRERQVKLQNQSTLPVINKPDLVKTPKSAIGGKPGTAGGGLKFDHSNKHVKPPPEFTSIENATIFYGSVVAFQSGDGKYLTVDEVSGRTITHHWPHVEKYGIRQRATHPGPDDQNGRMLFTLYDMRNPASQEPIHYGDPVWLAISPGNGHHDWRRGSVLAAHIDKAPQLATIGLESSSVIRNPNSVTLKVGVPCPCKSIVYSIGMKNRHDIVISGPVTNEHKTGWYNNKDPQFDKLYRDANAAGLTMGRWVMLPQNLDHQESIRKTKASAKAREAIEGLFEKHKAEKDSLASDGYESRELVTGDEVYLEQDWFYICGNPSKDARGEIILRQLPGSNEDSALVPANAKPKRSPRFDLHGSKSGKSESTDEEVDRRGVFKIRLISGGQTSKPKNKEAAKTEATFHHARQQLKKSRLLRDGELHQYENKTIRGGEKFSLQVRLIQQDIDISNDNHHFSNQDKKMAQLDSYFEDLYNESPIKIYAGAKKMPKRRDVSPAVNIIAGSRGSTPKTPHKKKDDERLLKRKLKLLSLLHQSASGPHLNLFDPDRQVSARLLNEAEQVLQNAKTENEAENRLSRLLKYSPIPWTEINRESKEDGITVSSFSATSNGPSRPISRASSNPYALERAADPLEVTDEAMAKLLGSHGPVADIIKDEDGQLEIMIRAAEREEIAKQTAALAAKKELKRKEDTRVPLHLRGHTPKTEVS